MRWLLLILTAFAFVLGFTRHSGGALACWLLLGLIGTFATALAFAQVRIDDRSRSETLSEYDLRRLREGQDPLNHDRSTSQR